MEPAGISDTFNQLRIQLHLQSLQTSLSSTGHLQSDSISVVSSESLNSVEDLAFGQFSNNNSHHCENNSSSTNVSIYSSFDACSFQNVEEVVQIIVPLVFAIIVIIGLLGNSLVVIVVLWDVQMRSTTNVLIFNLAVADLLFIVFCVPFTATDYALAYWPFGDIWCRIVQYLIYVSAYASIYTLVLMSLDRFMAVVHPIASLSIRTEANAYRAITFLWIAIILLCLPTLVVHQVHRASEQENDHVCHVNSIDNKIFAPSVFLSSYAIPLTLAFILYVCMLKRLWHNDIRTGRSVRNKRKVTRMVVVVVVIFAICWGPIHIVLTLRSQGLFEPDSKFKLVSLIVSQVLAYINSCINPILYAFLSENFRKAFRKVISCKPGPGSRRTRSGSAKEGETNRMEEITTATFQTTKRIELTNGCV
ncbi:allatostatin-A receptor-like [Panonychus citri]|uniref:allatostatin-A receptor-like n=1 Tax=Panonychus citri TaxID=50023 RepID=UPI0023073015|nr:allatostatin-A receptor-like [Panonychus citri]